MEAPEKLYFIQHNGLVCYCRNNKDDIEYISKNTFIKKACEWLKDLYSNYSIREFYTGESFTEEEFIERFKKAMGE